jgi:hypothetical protein
MDTHRPVDAWGPYRPAIEDHLASCADYLGRLQRSLAGEIAPDRHYFRSKAHQLEQVARSLVRRAQDIERWLDACEAPVVCHEPGASHVATCELPRGHRGAHDDNPPPTGAEQARDAARDLTDLAAQASDRLGWLAPLVDRADATGEVADRSPNESLLEVSTLLGRVSRDSRVLATRVRGLELPSPGPDTVPAEPEDGRLGGVSLSDPAVGL